MKKINTIIFDYGGTLDTDARHWAHVLFEGYRHAQIPVDEPNFRDAYVYGERALAKALIVLPDDDFHTVLLKKVDQETIFLRDNNLWTPSEEERQKNIKAVADYCNAYVERNMEVTRRVLSELNPAYNMVLVSNFYGNIHAILRQYRIDHFFSAVIESAVVGVRNPTPPSIKWELTQQVAPPKRCSSLATATEKTWCRQKPLAATPYGCAERDGARRKWTKRSPMPSFTTCPNCSMC